jgi:hypothetical protein
MKNMSSTVWLSFNVTWTVYDSRFDDGLLKTTAIVGTTTVALNSIFHLQVGACLGCKWVDVVNQNKTSKVCAHHGLQ